MTAMQSEIRPVEKRPAVNRLVLKPEPPAKLRETVVVFQCIKCKSTRILKDFGPAECCGQKYLVDEYEGIIPDGWIYG